MANIRVSHLFVPENDALRGDLEGSLVSNFIRLCVAEGVDSTAIYRELEMRLDALDDLKSTKT